MAVSDVDLARRKLCPSKYDIHLLLYCVYLERRKFGVVGKLMKQRSVDVHVNASGSLGRFIEDKCFQCKHYEGVATAPTLRSRYVMQQPMVKCNICEVANCKRPAHAYSKVASVGLQVR